MISARFARTAVPAVGLFRTFVGLHSFARVIFLTLPVSLVLPAHRRALPPRTPDYRRFYLLPTAPSPLLRTRFAVVPPAAPAGSFSVASCCSDRTTTALRLRYAM